MGSRNMARGRRRKVEKTKEVPVEEAEKTIRPSWESPGAKKIALDIDGTLANVQERLLNIAGHPADLNILDTWTKLYDVFGGNAVFWKAYTRAWSNFEDIKPTDDTIRYTIDQLMRSGHVVDIVTLRPATTEIYTRRWLQRNAIPYNNLVIIDADLNDELPTGEEKLALDYDVYVDDNPYMGVLKPDKVILYDRPWNKSVEAARVYKLEGLLNIIKV